MKLNILTLFVVILSTYATASNSISRHIAASPQDSKKIKLLVIDTGVYPHRKIKPYLSKYYEKIDYTDMNGHGTHIAGIALFGDLGKSNSIPVCSEVEVYSCNFMPVHNDKDTLKNTIKCLQRAVKEGFDFINYSAGGEGSNPQEEDLLRQIAAKGTKIVVAAGNESQMFDVANYFPAKYNIENLIPVGNLNYDHQVSKTSNYGGGLTYDYGEDIYSTSPNDTFKIMTGTSQAAAMYTHRLLHKRCSQINTQHKKMLAEREKQARMFLYGGQNERHAKRK